MSDDLADPLSITNHALLRWLERAHGIDIEFFRNEMRRELEASLRHYGDDMESEHQGTFILDGASVVTFLAPGQRMKKSAWIGGVGIMRRTA